MGLFDNLFTKPKRDSLVDWLNKVDQAYQRAFQVKNAAGLSDYLTRTCLSKTMEKIRFGEKAYSGLARYQTVSWVKGEETVDAKEYYKEVTYDNIQMSHGIVVPVGDNSKELWVVVTEDGNNKISDIRRI